MKLLDLKQRTTSVGNGVDLHRAKELNFVKLSQSQRRETNEGKQVQVPRH